MFFAVQRINRIISELGGFIYTDRTELGGIKTKECGYRDYGLLEEHSDGWEPFGPDERWGEKDGHRWFRASFTVPDHLAGKRLVLRLETGAKGWDALNPQFMIFVDGKLMQGLDVNHTEMPLCREARPGETWVLDFYAYAGMQDGRLEFRPSVSVLNEEVEKLYYHLLVPLKAAQLMENEDKRRIDILNFLTEAVNRIDLRQPLSKSFFCSVTQTARYLDEEFYGRYCSAGDVTELCVGHTHIDVAWLWPLAQTREKTVRSFSTVISLMKQYPDYTFMSSQPQLYKFVKEDRPDLYEEIKAMVKAGRWEAEGAMWLEADCNLTSGESLVRQILFGKRFFRKEFGVDNKVLWLPDVFGYSAALPQILKKSGVDYFMTTKISWNEFNKLPYDTFLWKGLDGTEVLTYFVSTQGYNRENASTVTTYNGDLEPSSVLGCWNRYQQKEINSEVLNCFGFGDGGGGPTKYMLEEGKRLQKGIPGIPTVQYGTARDFFQRLENRVGRNKRLPEWVGELYLEYHRGTYTTMARNKKYNRKTEFLNEQAEIFSSLNSVLCGGSYPQTEINGCWETTLLNQFHDIIPGSSIKEVYEVSKAQYEKINAEGRKIVSQALDGIVSHIGVEETSAVVFNPLGFVRSSAVELELPQGWNSAQVYDSPEKLATQRSGKNGIVFFARNVPATGYKTFVLRKEEPEKADGGLRAGKTLLENRFFTLRFNGDGNIVSIYDRRSGREVLMPGRLGNQMLAFEDKPFDYDAWNIDIYYQEKEWEINEADSIEVAECGPVKASLKIRRKFLDSVIEQVITVYSDIARIDFNTTIDWKEKQILLKTAFPVDVHAEKAAYEIQYGNVERPTHWNTSWDWARFEVCGHKWADISEGNYGVSMLNDCKYGHDIKDSVMRLTLLKSAVSPNPDADREIHHFVYSIYPHAGSWKTAGTEEAAYDLNCPLVPVLARRHEGNLPQELSFLKTDAGNVMLEVVKKAEDSGDTVVRLFEYKNERSRVRVTSCRPLSSVSECNLLEEEDAAVPCEGNSFEFTARPYEIRTFKIRFR